MGKIVVVDTGNCIAVDNAVDSVVEACSVVIVGGGDVVAVAVVRVGESDDEDERVAVDWGTSGGPYARRQRPGPEGRQRHVERVAVASVPAAAAASRPQTAAWSTPPQEAPAWRRRS